MNGCKTPLGLSYTAIVCPVFRKNPESSDWRKRISKPTKLMTQSGAA